jgi:Ni/Co efflux regulator RcnB
LVGDPAWASPPSSEPENQDEARPEARVAGVELDVTIWRGGEQAPNRKRIPRRRAEVDGWARYRLEAPASAGQELV